MANLDKSNIVNGGTIESSHLTDVYDALTGVTVYDNISTTGTSSYAITASYAENAGGATVDTGSLLTTASVDLNTITFTKGDASTFNITVNTGSANSITDGIKTLDFDGSNNLRSNTNFLPSLNDTFDLGSADKKWRDLYLGDNSIYMSGSGGWMTGSWDGTNFKINNSPLISSSVTGSMVVGSTNKVNSLSSNAGQAPVSTPLSLAGGNITLEAGVGIIGSYADLLVGLVLGRNCFITVTAIDGTTGAFKVSLNEGGIRIDEIGGSSNGTVNYIIMYLTN